MNEKRNGALDRYPIEKKRAGRPSVTVKEDGAVIFYLYAPAAKIVQAAARNSYKLDKCLYEPLTISIASSFNCISSFEKELKAIDKAILKTVQGLNPDEYTVLNSIPGIGKVYSAGILAELGSIKAFQNANQLAKYCGIVWNDNDSGDFESEDSRMSKAGNRYLRYYIIEATGSVINHCPEYKAFYQKKYAETRNHQHK